MANGKNTITASIAVVIVVMGVLCMPTSFAKQCFADPKQAYSFLVKQDLSKQNTMININTASVGELIKLHGVGVKTAENIILYRTHFGQFEHIDDLMKVKGIGIKTLDKNRHRLSVK